MGLGRLLTPAIPRENQLLEQWRREKALTQQDEKQPSHQTEMGKVIYPFPASQRHSLKYKYPRPSTPSHYGQCECQGVEA
jgi:hypothetical protein